MSIYPRNCYTYLIGWSHLDIKYYGRKTAKMCNPDDFWKTYFTSSHKVKAFREKYGEPDIIQIRKTFGEDILSCKKWECTVLRRLNVKHNEKFLNMSNGDYRLDTTGLRVAILVSTGEKLGMVSCNDPRWETKEIVAGQKGKGTGPKPSIKGTAVAKCTKTNKSIGRVKISDPRWVSGEIVSIMKNNPRGTTYDGMSSSARCNKTNELLGMISLSDPRWKTKEIVSVLLGTKRISQYGMSNAMTRDGVKIGKIHISDNRWTTGEIISTLTGKCNLGENKQPALDVNLVSIGAISLSDPRWIKNEIIGCGIRYFYIIEQNSIKKIIKTKDLPNFKSWNIIFMSLKQTAG